MTREEIVDMFRVDNPEFTSRVLTDAQLYNWLLILDKEIAAETRCIFGDTETITTAENDEYINLTAEIDDFYDINEFPGGGVAYNDKRLTKATKAELDAESSNWRTRDSGTPKKYYRQGKYIYFDRPIDSNHYDVTVDPILISDDFDDDDKMPFNQLPYLKPFHYSLVLGLQKKAKMKRGKGKEELKAIQEFDAYVKWMKKMLRGGDNAPIFLQPVK